MCFVTIVVMDEPRAARTIDKILVMFKPLLGESSVPRNDTVYYRIVPNNEIVRSSVKGRVLSKTKIDDKQRKSSDQNEPKLDQEQKMVKKTNLESVKSVVTLFSSGLVKNETNNTKSTDNDTATVSTKQPTAIDNATEADVSPINLEEEAENITTTTTTGVPPINEDAKLSSENITTTTESLGTSNKTISLNFIQALLAEGDPGLVKVLLDNSTSANLNVFLDHSNVTVDELKHFIEV